METKLRRLIIGTFIGTFVLLVGMVVAWNMVLIRPLNESRATALTALEAESKVGAQLGANLKLKVKQEKNLILLQDQLDAYRLRFRAINFDFGPTERERTWKGYMTEYSREYGLALREEVKGAADEIGVDVTASAAVEAPPQKPEDVPVPGGFLKPVVGGSVGLALEARSFNDILRFLKRINQGKILMMVGNVKLEGYAPAIKATLTITPYLLTKGPGVKLPAPPSTAEKVGDAAAEAVQGAAAAVGGEEAKKEEGGGDDA